MVVVLVIVYQSDEDEDGYQNREEVIVEVVGVGAVGVGVDDEEGDGGDESYFVLLAYKGCCSNFLLHFGHRSAQLPLPHANHFLDILHFFPDFFFGAIRNICC